MLPSTRLERVRALAFLLMRPLARLARVRMLSLHVRTLARLARVDGVVGLRVDDFLGGGEGMAQIACDG